ncbi:hypothetical protein [Synechococcus sp. A15-60]|uniref:hypothetical protein n=1 Tax=Synechococcus sp. A15-60 TaxID=1050655 RepID=UPI0016450FD0|nr:hypothetical protein [Synechococcus sp. A15-60]QNI48864.1 hypothetical protein SynA1560_02215 [Synechococcus sp. A15-60]
MPKKPTIVPSELLGAALAWEELRESYWSRLGCDTTDIRMKINGLERRVQTESMEQG